MTEGKTMADPAVIGLVEALRYYAAEHHENPNDGPWGVNSVDFGDVARAALAKYAALTHPAPQQGGEAVREAVARLRQVQRSPVGSVSCVYPHQINEGWGGLRADIETVLAALTQTPAGNREGGEADG